MAYNDSYSSYKDDNGTDLYNTTYTSDTYHSTMTKSSGYLNGDSVYITYYVNGTYGATETQTYNNDTHSSSTYKTGYQGK